MFHHVRSMCARARPDQCNIGAADTLRVSALPRAEAGSSRTRYLAGQPIELGNGLPLATAVGLDRMRSEDDIECLIYDGAPKVPTQRSTFAPSAAASCFAWRMRDQETFEADDESGGSCI